MATRGKRITRNGKADPVNFTRAVRKESTATKDTPRFTKVHLRIHEIECIKTTKEIDQDEITLAAIKVEGELQNSGGKKKLAAKAAKGEVLDTGKFKKGDTRKYNPPRTVLSFAAGDKNDGWPRYYYATLLMIEEDERALGTILNEAVKSVEKGVAEAVAQAASTAATAVLSGLAAGAAAGSAVPIPLIGTAVGAAAGTAVGLVASQIKKARKDDVFDPKNIHLRLDRFPSDGGEIEGSNGRLAFQDFQGHYVVTYSWTIS
jgi:hypothetical protein